ncbi:major allergen Pru ar 1-like [Olea europaea var. sylvestris]|uniref:major allergen Pru ar 1-like n=1 Tax=Olea europaea var. sylvestris TaxID=158386 RepID=UPI000C1CEAAA|nr:major allergen Pru ar 1-like [Olea europaea var. sylvestris]
MGVVACDVEITSSVPAARMFEAIVLDSDNLIPKIMPRAIESVEILEGDGGVGTIKLVNFGEDSQFKSVKYHVDALDTENFTQSYSILEGEVLMGIFESITYHIEILANADGGCICKSRSIYNTKGDVQITEEKIKEGKEKTMAMFKAIEAYLQANPDA